MESVSTNQGPRAALTIQDLLKAELARRCRQNPAYSLRSFAKSLGLSPGYLSNLLKGQRRFTPKTLALVSEQLSLDPTELARFRRAASRKPAVDDLEGASYRRIELDQFQFIADWFHFAILELTTLRDFEASPKYIARKLGINSHQAADALSRLERLGYLARDKRGKLKLVEEHNTTIGRPVAHAAAREQQRQFLELALKALQETPLEKRSQTSMTMAIPADRLPEATEAITEFRRKLTALLQRPGARDSVYQLSISFFPLTK